MTRDEWDELSVGMLAYWPNRQVPGEAFDLWYGDLEEFPVEQVKAAVRALGRDGREWIPTGGQIREKILELASESLDHTQAFALATEALRHGGFYTGLQWLREQSQLAAEAAEAFGWESFCRDGETGDGTRRAQFRECFKAVSERAGSTERYRGITAPGLEALESGSGGLKKLSAGSLVQPEED